MTLTAAREQPRAGATQGGGTTLLRFTRNSDLYIALAAVAIVVMMIVPIPPIFLDILLTLNITIALVIMLVSMYTLQPLQFSIFPSLLLLVTLFRLSLNVSGTRLILLYGYAGDVINAFGQFVVGGSYIVGFIIFVILIIIQFIVITNGAGRVAEVAARFTLDAMPGKQMAIDADLNAGLITEDDARYRRRQIQKEADFYGAMDGASKFVRGDAMAAIIILIVNILGGFIIGMVQRGLPFMESLKVYTLLTIGEGLVTQIPALLISTSTGIIVTRAASDINLGVDLTTQLFQQPRVVIMVGFILLFFFAMPGLPKIPFLLLAVGALMLGRALRDAQKKAEVPEEKPAPPKEPESMVPLLQLDPMELEIGYGLIPLVDIEQGGDLLERITMIRRQLATDLGLVVPPVRVRDNMQLKPNSYSIKIYGLEVAKGEVIVGRFLAMNPGGAVEEVEGIPTKEPAFGLPAVWVAKVHKEKAEVAGYTVIDPSTVVATHFTEIIKTSGWQLLGRQEVQLLIDTLKTSHSVVVEELIPNLLTVGDIQKILQNLLKERISIRNLLLILEALADHARGTKDIESLTEIVRQALARAICKDYMQPDGTLPVITLDPALENMLADLIRGSKQDAFVTLDPQTIREIYDSLLKEVERLSSSGFHPVLLCSQVVRPYFKHLTERVVPYLAVLSYQEIVSDANIEAFGVVRIGAVKVADLEDPGRAGRVADLEDPGRAGRAGRAGRVADLVDPCGTR